MKFTRQTMLYNFQQLETELEGDLRNMRLYHDMSDKELSKLHRETFDAMYEGDESTKEVKLVLTLGFNEEVRDVDYIMSEVLEAIKYHADTRGIVSEGDETFTGYVHVSPYIERMI